MTPPARWPTFALPPAFVYAHYMDPHAPSLAEAMDLAPRWWAQLAPVQLTEAALRDLRTLGYIQ